MDIFGVPVPLDGYTLLAIPIIGILIWHFADGIYAGIKLTSWA